MVSVLAIQESGSEYEFLEFTLVLGRYNGKDLPKQASYTKSSHIGELWV